MKITLLKFSDPKKEEEFNQQIDKYANALMGYLLGFYLVGRIIENNELKESLYQQFPLLQNEDFLNFISTIEELFSKEEGLTLSSEALKSLYFFSKTIIGEFITIYQTLLKDNAQTIALDIDEDILELLAEGNLEDIEEAKDLLEKMSNVKALPA